MYRYKVKQIRLHHERATIEKLQEYMEADAELKAFLNKPLEEMEGGYKSAVASVLSSKMDKHSRWKEMWDKVTPVYFDPANARTILDIIKKFFGQRARDIQVEFIVTDNGKPLAFMAYDCLFSGYPMVAKYPILQRLPSLDVVNDISLISFVADIDWSLLEDDIKRFIQMLRKEYYLIHIVPVKESRANNMLATVFTQYYRAKNVSIGIERSDCKEGSVILDGYVVNGKIFPHIILPFLQLHCRPLFGLYNILSFVYGTIVAKVYTIRHWKDFYKN